MLTTCIKNMILNCTRTMHRNFLFIDYFYSALKFKVKIVQKIAICRNWYVLMQQICNILDYFENALLSIYFHTKIQQIICSLISDEILLTDKYFKETAWDSQAVWFQYGLVWSRSCIIILFILLIRLKQAQKITIVRYKNKGAFKSSDSVNMYKVK